MIDQNKRRTLKVVSATAAVTAIPLSTRLFAKDSVKKQINAGGLQRAPEVVVVCDSAGCVSTMTVKNETGEVLQSIQSNVISVPGGRLDINYLTTNGTLNVNYGQQKSMFVSPEYLDKSTLSNSAHGIMRFPVTNNVIVDHIPMVGKTSGKIYKLPVRLERAMHA